MFFVLTVQFSARPFSKTSPAATEGSDVDKINAFRAAFLELEKRIKAFTHLPVDQLDTPQLQKKINEIGKF